VVAVNTKSSFLAMFSSAALLVVPASPPNPLLVGESPMLTAHMPTGASKWTRNFAQPHSFVGSRTISTTVSHHPSLLESANSSGSTSRTYLDHGSVEQLADIFGA
jgi:hypothetical protein